MSTSVRNNVINHPATFSLTPKTLDEAMQYSKLISESDFCPREHKGKPGNVLVAVQYGAELGLSPMQALQNISVINGRPCVWGDALLGLVMANPTFVNIHEEINNGVAVCIVERKGKEPVQRTFSIDDAKKANLWGKSGTWTQYPNRMLQMRARGFALRDSFPDVLKGLMTREEVEDYEVKPKRQKINVNTIDIPAQETILSGTLYTSSNGYNIEELCKGFGKLDSIESLRDYFNQGQKLIRSHKNKDDLQRFIAEKDVRLNELNTVIEYNKEIDEATGEIE